MTTLSAPPSGPASQAPADILATLKSQAGSAALRLQETLDSVVVAFETHHREIASLREALSRVEARMQAQTPAISAMVQPVRMPEPPAPVHAQVPFQAAPAPRVPSGPIMTQILWPSKEGQPELPPPPIPASTRPISKPISIVESMLNGAPPPSAATVLPPVMQAPAPMAPSPVSSASVMNPPPVFAPAIPHAADSLSPQLEKATLEELNAALAYAFAQVSGTKGLGKGGITQMMPPPLPTQAMRFGQAPDYAGQM